MKYNLSQLMKTAWQFVKMNGFTMAEAMKQAWMQFKLRAKMTKGIVKFYFQKIDGSVREAFGTLNENMVPATGGNRKANPTIQTYFDTEKGEWRCYKIANLLRIA